MKYSAVCIFIYIYIKKTLEISEKKIRYLWPAHFYQRIFLLDNIHEKSTIISDKCYIQIVSPDKAINAMSILLVLTKQ